MADRNTNNIKLTDKELYILWSLVCWFDTPFTSTVKYKLSGMSRSPLRKGLEQRYDRRIEDQIIQVGGWLKMNRERRATPESEGAKNENTN